MCSVLPDALRPTWFEGLFRGIQFATSATWIYTTYQLSPGTLFGFAEDTVQSNARLNRIAAEQSLELILSMKGYYIKAAQTLCGAGQFPPEFDDAFAVLLDQCPREPFRVVRSIVENELGCRLEEVFQSFDEDAIAAASVGQVHFAVLNDGAKVAVKVQYPEVEMYFRMDVKTMSFAMQLMGMESKVKEIFQVMEDQFEQEFDYTKEAVVMREVAENILPHYSKHVKIPLPIDSSHPSCPQHVVPTLCTRKVLTMERLEGTPIREKSLPMMEMFARMHETTVDELKKQMNCKDPTKMDMENKAFKAAMAMRRISEGQSLMLIAAIKVRNAALGFLGCVFGGACCGQNAQPQWTKRKLAVPLNGPRLAKLLYEVHGHELFQNGLFNSDPHAGNVLMLPDGRLGLLDYGAVMRLTEEQRTCIARMFVAIADEDDNAVPQTFWACGFKSKRQDPRLALLLAHVFFNRGPFPDDMNRLAPKVGMPQNPDIMTLDTYVRGGKLDDIEEFPGHLVMLQRCCMVLSGIGMELGAGRLSSAAMLKPQALKWLRAKAK
mmetsp:Transcript_109046/g.307356  ORF Transcript_109046/g.307356 Transcript_109046/m.307356 type:complete len:549 (-) Transcript_109046:42-1688(-)